MIIKDYKLLRLLSIIGLLLNIPSILEAFGFMVPGDWSIRNICLVIAGNAFFIFLLIFSIAKIKFKKDCERVSFLLEELLREIEEEGVTSLNDLRRNKNKDFWDEDEKE